MSEVTIASVVGASVFCGAFALSVFMGGESDTARFAASPVRPPILSTRSATEGAPAYDHYCASCHGGAGQGGRNGPPLVHPLYDIGEKTDSMFVAAMRRGAPQKHWKFGAMPPVKGISARHAAAVVGFVAELQVYNAR
jgi:mono/diheme cytochrome c family protein